MKFLQQVPHATVFTDSLQECVPPFFDMGPMDSSTVQKRWPLASDFPDTVRKAIRTALVYFLCQKHDIL